MPASAGRPKCGERREARRGQCCSLHGLPKLERKVHPASLRIYVHPNSLRLLQQKMGDLIIQPFCDGAFIATPEYAAHHETKFRVVERNDLPLMWPESEETEG